jgi:hypothetical protein
MKNLKNDPIEELRSRHLDKDDKISFSISKTAKNVYKQNFGQRRLLSELVLIRENSEDHKKYSSFRENTKKLRKLLEEGWF